MQKLHIVATVNVSWNIWNFRRPLIEDLIAQGHKLTILAPPDDTSARLSALGCEFIPLQMNRKGLNPFGEVLLFFRFLSVFIRLKPDVILGYTIKNNLFGALAARVLRVPFIPNVTGLGTAFLSTGLLKKVARHLYRLAFARCPVVFFQNSDDRNLFLENGLVTRLQARQLAGSGIDLEKFSYTPYPSSNSAPVFLMISRLLRDKGIIEYVEAAALTKTQLEDARFLVVGAAGAENRSSITLDQIREYEATHGIEYLGTTDDVRAEIAAANCIVLPSYREGAPRTLIEGSALGRPIIATDVPGCRAVVQDGETGFLCEVRSARDLADKMLTFAALTTDRQREMGLAARKKVEREFDAKLVVHAYHRALDYVIDAYRSGSRINSRKTARDHT
ncbi:MAG: glycosyltransferase family 4 protein [Alteraurantiacibacter sp. bin_em_oilr2.035]|nr:glycosyltransferase family 4 protein [Alteraurantiacibacter sp. bin_em_oilr2.035]